MPLAWTMIERGWRVTCADGVPLGRVDEVLADEELDIFSGLVVASGITARRRRVDASLVGAIEDGEVALAILSEEIGELPPLDG